MTVKSLKPQRNGVLGPWGCVWSCSPIGPFNFVGQGYASQGWAVGGCGKNGAVGGSGKLTAIALHGSHVEYKLRYVRYGILHRELDHLVLSSIFFALIKWVVV